MIKPGLYRLTLEIQKPIKRAQFDTRPPWLTVVKVKGRKLRSSGNESLEQSGQVSTSNILFSIRFIGDINRSYRVKIGEEIYSIEDIQNVRDKNRELIIECSRGTNRQNRGG